MQHPVLSVIVCTYNREKYIGECLKHLANQSLDKSQYEVLVINNISTDNTQTQIDRIIMDHPEITFRSIIEKNQGHTFARNRGIRESHGSILSFIDDDAFVSFSFCKEIIHFFTDHENVSAIGGRIIPKYEEKKPDWMSNYLLPLVAALDLGSQKKPFRAMKFPIGANMAFRASIFNRYGHFDVNLGRRGSGLEGGDEKEMFIRMRKGDEQIWYVPQVMAKHIIPPHRVEKPYIKGLAIGVGASERKRLSNESFNVILNKAFSELIKTSATFALSVFYTLKGRSSKGIMLIKFRYWVISGYFYHDK